MSAEPENAQLKAALRVRILAKLTGLDHAKGARFTARIFERAPYVVTFASMARELGTHNLIRHCLLAGKKVCVPAFDRERKRYFTVAIEDFDRDLSLGHYGILEPRDAKPTDLQADIAFLPGLAFDQRGNRLGRGEGNFETLLTGFRGVKVALAFDVQFVDSVPAITKDVPMDVVGTEERVVRVTR
ncbi:MAG: 5-formyltetrahydrofolate cyclo-ligase [Verrucomicrobiae bacterium]|nr:5-formyltetrahydrofolate cyclo-ligase [Verrucomicrobiae bacterium]